MNVLSSDIHVIKRDRIYATIRSIWDVAADKLEKEKVYEVKEKLKVLTNAEDKPVAEIIQNETIVCPQCGGELTLRVAKRGTNAGNRFYGCSNYPKCRYVQNTEPSKSLQ